MIRCFLQAASILHKVEKRPVVVLAAAMLAIVPVLPAELWLMKELIDRIQGWNPSLSSYPILTSAAWLAALMLVNNIGLGVPIPMALTRINEIGALEQQRLVLEKTSRLPLQSVESPSVKDIRERALRVSLHEIYNTGLQWIQQLIQAALLVSILLAFGQWIPLAAIIGATVLLSIVTGKSVRSLEKLSRSQTPDQRLMDHYAGLMTGKEAAKEIRLFGHAPELEKRWRGLYERQSRDRRTAVRVSELRKLGPELLLALLSGLLLALLVLLPGARTFTAGDFAVLFMTMTMLLAKLPEIVRTGGSFQKLYMRWEDFRTYLELEEDASAGNAGRAETCGRSAAGGGLRLSDVSFRYPGMDRKALDGIRMTIPPGCRAALVGENGSGKSTLVKLLAGFYQPSEGGIDWGGLPASGLELDREPERERNVKLAAVFQDFSQLHVRLRENVALGQLAELHNDPAIEAALRSAGYRKSGLDTQLGAAFGGIEPSGGEWQKIATARALMRDADFVFFDEPTAALDPQAEREAFELFMKVTEGKSALLVTHRLGAAKQADLVFVLRQGKLVEQGTHEELMRMNGEYCRMYRTQASWYSRD
ncbi:ABC transporter ATP-binding protein [Paenibacillus sp. GYB004]|uniref:ABC transporter ATP-binding protein n=1 Tax=Paenibacillus sp. GYB004 TaxID=2994393 RepID=UPI002F962F64